MADVPEVSLEAMRALGQAYRDDWSEFDGRTLRDQLNELEDMIRKELAGEDVTRHAESLLWTNERRTKP